MKIFLRFIMMSCFALPLCAQQTDVSKYNVEILEISSPEFDWSQFDNDNSECKYRKDALMLECKKNKMYACTVSELEFDVTGVDFVMSFRMEPEELDDAHPFGIIFDYKNIKNFQVLSFGKKQFQLLSYEGGEQAMVKEGLFKLNREKSVVVTMAKKGKRIDFYIGSQNLPLTSLRNYEIKNSVIGFFVENRTKLKLTGVGYRLIAQQETESEN